MPSSAFCVYNETREKVLCSRVELFDSDSDPLKLVQVVVESLVADSDTALWFDSPYTLPMMPRLAPFDVVFLDRDCHVVHAIEMASATQVPSFSGHAESALVLPFRTFTSTQSHPGDRVVLLSAEELARKSSTLPQHKLPEFKIPEHPTRSLETAPASPMPAGPQDLPFERPPSRAPLPSNLPDLSVSLNPPIEIDTPLTPSDFLATFISDPLTGPQPACRRPFYRNKKTMLDRFMAALLRVKDYIASPPPLFQVRPSRYSRQGAST